MVPWKNETRVLSRYLPPVSSLVGSKEFTKLKKIPSFD